MGYGLSRNWWALAIRGVAALAFGVLAFLFPGGVLIALVYLFGAYALVDGFFAIAAVLTGQEAQGERWWALLVEGVLGMVVGLTALFSPIGTALALLILFAIWSIATGIFEIIAAIRLRRQLADEWALALAGVVSVLFGVALLLAPPLGLLALAWLMGAYAIVFGVMMLVLAFRLRRWGARAGSPGFTP
jgi:uncharacterized membrane protein HdeD (DUF308 family)